MKKQSSHRSSLLDHYKPILNETICELIKRRRRQIMVHSFIYYRIGTSLISDKTFDNWAYELKDLQLKYPNESKNTELYNEFKDWDGTTGYYLDTYIFEHIAQRLLRIGGNNEYPKI